jgi:uncharacterized membrane protein YfcA
VRVPSSICCGELLADPLLPWTIAAMVLAGVVRGVSGFGQALVFIPLAGLLYQPKFAVPLLWVADGLVTPLLLRPHARVAQWGEIVPLAIGGAVMLPAGIWLLNNLDAIVLRWAICSLVLLSTIGVAAGWRFRVTASRPVSLVVGGLSGLAGGATGMSGVPLVLFWLGRDTDAARIRSNVFVYLWLLGLVSLVAGAALGVVGSRVVLDGVVLAPGYAVATVVGNRVFHRGHGTSAGEREAMFRRLALGLCASSAVAGLPLWR